MSINVDRQFEHIFGFGEDPSVENLEDIEFVDDDFFETFKDELTNSETLTVEDFEALRDVKLPDPLTQVYAEMAGVDYPEAAWAAGDPQELQEITNNLIDSIPNDPPLRLQEKVKAYIAGVKTDDPAIGKAVVELKEMAYFIQNIRIGANKNLNTHQTNQRNADIHFAQGEFGTETFEAISNVSGEIKNKEGRTSLAAYLTILADVNLKYRNVLYEVMNKDGMVSLELTNSRMMLQEDKMQHQKISTDRQQRKRRKMIKKMKEQNRLMKGLGITLIIVGTLLAVASMGTSSVFSATLFAMGAGMAVGGSMMTAQSEGTDFGSAIAKSAADDFGKDGAMILLISVAVVAAALTAGGGMAIAAGSTSFAANSALIGGTIVMSAMMPAAVAAYQEERIQHYENKGSEKAEMKAAHDAMVFSIAFSATVLVVSVGGMYGASRAGTTAAQAADDAAIKGAQGASAGGTGSTGGGTGSAGGAGAKGGAAAGTGSGAAGAGSAAGAGTAGGSGAASGATKAAQSTFQKMVESVKSSVSATFDAMHVAALNISATAQAFEAISQGTLAVISAQLALQQGDIAKMKAHTEAHLTMMTAAVDAVKMASEQMLKGAEGMPQLITQVSENFTQAIEDMSKTLSAITSGQSAAHSMQSSGSTAPSKPTKQMEEQAAQAVAAPAAAAAGQGTVSGVESKAMNEAASAKKQFAMLAIIRAVASNIAKALIAQGMKPNDAMKVAMYLATTLLKTLAQTQQNGLKLPPELQLKAEENPALLALAAMLSKSSKTDPELKKLMDSDNLADLGDLGDDKTMDELIKVLEKLSKDDPEMAQLLSLIKGLRGNPESPFSFAFKTLQAMTAAINLSGEDVEGEENKEVGVGKVGKASEAAEEVDILDLLLGGEAQVELKSLEEEGDPLAMLGDLLGSGEEEKKELNVGFQYIRS